MFFMMGMYQSRKDIDYNKMVICNECGSYGKYIVFITYSVLSLFFIPVFKWNKKYYVETSCCHTLYELNPEVGKQLESGQDIEIQSFHLQKLSNSTFRKCPNCGFYTEQDFQYCPKCGTPF